MFDNSYQEEHDPESTTRLSIPWRAWLPCGDRISSSTWEGTGVTISSPSVAGTTAQCLITGGTLNNTYRVYNTIVTTGGLTERRFIDVKVIDKPAVKE